MRLDHDRYLLAVRDESERFATALSGVAPTTPVPSCTGWTAADLLHHLGEVQHFWAQVVRGGDGDELEDPARPDDDALVEFVARGGTELLGALAEHGPGDPCWSWHEDGRHVGWVARRQAHEALVHRVDAELTAGLAATPPSVELAADGVDELLRVFVHGVPEWGAFTPDGLTARFVAENAHRSWTLALGRFTGTSPASGRTYDLDAGALLDPADDDASAADDLVVTGHAWDLDLWLWGRADASGLDVRGDRALLERVRALVGEATQ